MKKLIGSTVLASMLIATKLAVGQPVTPRCQPKDHNASQQAKAIIEKITSKEACITANGEWDKDKDKGKGKEKNR